MTTPDARPVSEERLAELIGEADAFVMTHVGRIHVAEMASALRELQSLRAEVERLRATGTESFRVAIYHQDRADKAEARLASLEARNASLEKDAALMRDLLELCGYLGDGSQTRVVIDQDDATRDWCLTVGKRTFYEPSLRAAIDAAREPATGSVKERV